MSLVTREALSQQSGRSYRTVVKRLAEAQVEPVVIKGTRRYYNLVEATAAVRFGQPESHPTNADLLSDQHEIVSQHIYPCLFSSGSPFVAVLIGYLLAECKLSRQQAVEAVLLASQGFMMAWTNCTKA